MKNFAYDGGRCGLPVEFDNDLAGCVVAFNRAIGFGDGRQRAIWTAM